MAANEIAAKFYRNELSQRLTAKQTSWLFSFGSVKNMNGYSVCAGSFSNNGVTLFWSATKIKYGSSIITYAQPEIKVVVPAKSNTRIILEAILEAFQNADDELDYSQISQEGKALITAQRKAINLEIRMNK